MYANGLKVNKKRLELKQNELEIISINLISFDNSIENKISSTLIRGYLIKYNYLKHQFKRLINFLFNEIKINNKNNIIDKFIDEWWYIISNLYNEKHRYYHTLNHIYHLLQLTGLSS